MKLHRLVECMAMDVGVVCEQSVFVFLALPLADVTSTECVTLNIKVTTPLTKSVKIKGTNCRTQNARLYSLSRSSATHAKGRTLVTTSTSPCQRILS